MKKIKVGYCGLNSIFGRIATSLLKQSPCIQKLTLYDDDKGSSNRVCEQNTFIGQDALFDALKDLNIVVIGDECYDLAESDDRLRLIGQKIIKYTEAILQCSPNAIVVVAASPLNIVVPLTSHLLGPDFSKRVLGTTCLDTLRASRLLNSYLDVGRLEHNYHILPIIGGGTESTRVPLFSQIHPRISITNEIQEKIRSRMRSFEAPHYQELDAIERAHSTVRFVHSLIHGMTKGSPIPEVTLSKSSAIPSVEFLSRPTLIGRGGVQKEFHLPQLNLLEEKQLSKAVDGLNSDVRDALDLAWRLKHENDQHHVEINVSPISLSHSTISDRITSSSQEMNQIQNDSNLGQFSIELDEPQFDHQPLEYQERRDENQVRLQKDSRVKKSVPGLPAYITQVHSKSLHTPKHGADGSRESNKPNSSYLRLDESILETHSSRPRTANRDSTGIKTLKAADEFTVETNQKALGNTGSSQEEPGSDILQEEVSQHLESLTFPIKSATQKFIELRQAKGLLDEKDSSDQFNVVKSDETGTTPSTPIPDSLSQIEGKYETEVHPSTQHHQQDHFIDSTHNLAQQTQSRQENRTSDSNRAADRDGNLLECGGDSESTPRFQRKDFPIPRNMMKDVSGQNQPTPQELNTRRNRNFSRIPSPKKENISEGNTHEIPDFCGMTENDTPSKSIQQRDTKVTSRRQKVTKRPVKSNAQTDVTNKKLKSPKQRKCETRFGNRLIPGKSASKLVGKTVKNNVPSIPPRKLVGTAVGAFESKESSVSQKKKHFQHRFTKLKTKHVDLSHSETRKEPTKHLNTNEMAGKHEDTHRRYKYIEDSLKPASKAFSGEERTHPDKESTVGTNQNVLLMSGNSKPHEFLPKPAHSARETENTHTTKYSVEPEKPEFSETLLSLPKSISEFEDVPEVHPDFDFDDASRSEAKITSKVLTTDKTKDYYIRERRVPQQTQATPNNGINIYAENMSEDFVSGMSEKTCIECEKDKNFPQELANSKNDNLNHPTDEALDPKAVMHTEEPPKNTKWDSKYLSIASEMLSKMFKDEPKSTHVPEVKSKHISKTNENDESRQQMPTTSKLKKFQTNLAAEDAFQNSSKHEKEELLLEKLPTGYTNPRRERNGQSKNRLTASDLNYKCRMKYSEKKFPQHAKSASGKSNFQTCLTSKEMRKIFKKSSNVRLDCVRSARRISGQNSQSAKTSKPPKSHNSESRPKVKSSKANEINQASVNNLEKTMTNRSIADENTLNFDQLFQETSQIPILEVRTSVRVRGESKNNSQNSSKDRPLNKLQANSQKPEEVIPLKPMKATSDKGRGDAVNTVSFTVNPKSNLTNTDNWDHQGLTSCETSTKHTPVDQNTRKCNGDMSKPHVYPPKSNNKRGEVPILSKTIKLAKLGKLGSSGPVRKTGTAQTNKNTKWERVFSVFKQIIINDVEGKDCGRKFLSEDQFPSLRKYTDDAHLIDGRQHPSVTAQQNQVGEVCSKKRSIPCKATETKLTALMSKNGSAAKIDKRTSLQRKRKVVEAMKRRKFVPKNSPKKIVNYFSKRVEPNESGIDRRKGPLQTRGNE